MMKQRSALALFSMSIVIAAIVSGCGGAKPDSGFGMVIKLPSRQK